MLAISVVASDYTYKTEFCKGGKSEQGVFYKHCKNNWQAKYDFLCFLVVENQNNLKKKHV